MGRSGDLTPASQLPPLVGSPILCTLFGPGWAEAFFGIPGDGPLIGAEAKCDLLVREGIRFHHRHALIGRQEALYFEPVSLLSLYQPVWPMGWLWITVVSVMSCLQFTTRRLATVLWGFLITGLIAGVPDDLAVVDPVPDTGFGEGIARLGDVNGDKLMDFAVSVPRIRLPNGGEGEVRVYFGSRAGVLAVPSQVLRPLTVEAGFGNRVASCDMNRDGFSDAIVETQSPLGTHETALSFWVFLGSTNGLIPPHEAAYRIIAGSGQHGFACLGDVNGDQFPDLAIGLGANRNGTGEVLIFHGNQACRWDRPDTTLVGSQAGEYFGSFGPAPGDLNGDGFADLVVGSTHYRAWDQCNGRAQLFLGSPHGLGSNAVWTAIYPLKPRAGVDENDDHYFGSSTAGVGDVNGDGHHDLIVTAPFAEQNDRNEGVAFGYYGTRLGLPATFSWTVQGNRPHAVLGLMAAGVGDLNGDGFDDVLVGAPDFENGQLREGLAAVFLGSPGGLPAEPNWTLEGARTHARLGQFGDGVGDLNGDGFDDLVIGQSGRLEVNEHHGTIQIVYGTAQGLRESSHITLAKPVLQWGAEEWRRLNTLSKSAAGGMGLALIGMAVLAGRHAWRKRTIILVERREQASRVEERERLARDLHDDIGSQLSRLALAVELVQRDAEDPTRTRTLTQTLSTTARDLRLALQSLTSTLQPEAGEVAGLIEFVGHQADQFLGPLGIRCFHEAPVATPSSCLKPEVRQELVACLREAMGNVIRHSQATEVWIRITCDESRLRVRVEDNGAGFIPEVVRRGNGLNNFQERMRRVAGTVIVDSQLGGGTRIEFQVPLLPSSQLAWN